MHGLLSSHTVVLPKHKPVTQTSPVVQALLSEQVPLLRAACAQLPLVQVSVVQALLSLQPPAFWQPLLQFWICANAHTPVLGLHTSSVQALLSLHTIAVPPHLPAVHLSPVVQATPSAHRLPSVTLTTPQLPVFASQESVVQVLLSLHTLAVPALHTPVAHWSPLVHRLPSSHGVALSANATHLLLAQVSVVQPLPSLQPALSMH